MFQIDYKVPSPLITQNDEANPLTYCQGNSTYQTCGGKAIADFSFSPKATQLLTNCNSPLAQTTNSVRRRRYVTQSFANILSFALIRRKYSRHLCGELLGAYVGVYGYLTDNVRLYILLTV